MTTLLDDYTRAMVSRPLSAPAAATIEVADDDDDVHQVMAEMLRRVSELLSSGGC